MPKSAKRLLRQERAAAKRLKSIEDAIPIERVWRDGVFLLANGNYAKTARLVDVNYAIASKEDKEALFVEYSGLLNALDSTATTKMTVCMRRIDREGRRARQVPPRVQRHDRREGVRRELHGARDIHDGVSDEEEGR